MSATERTVGGGPPWPPVVLTRFAELEVVAPRTLIKTTGGHGGPPLQYVLWRSLWTKQV